MKTVNGKMFRTLIWGTGLTAVAAAVLLSAPTRSVADRSDPGPSPLFKQSLYTSVKSLDRFQGTELAQLSAAALAQAAADERPEGRAADAALLIDAVEIESKLVAPGATNVTLEISIGNAMDITAMVIPLIARSLSGGAFWQGAVDTLPGHGRLTSALTTFRVFSTDVPSTPTQVALTYVSISDPCLAAGPLEGMTGLKFDVNGNPGQFEIDTAFYPPSSSLTFVDCLSGSGLTPAFTKGIVTITSPANGMRRGDLNCDGRVNLVDALAFDEYFRTGTLPSCIPATDVNADGIVLSIADFVYLVRIVSGTAAPFSGCITGCACCRDRITVESKTVAAGETGVKVGVFVENTIDVSVMVLPLEIRSITPGAYIANSFTLAVQGRVAASGLTDIVVGPNYFPTPDGVNSCSGPVTQTYLSQGAIDFVSPDAVLWVGVQFTNPCLAQGADDVVPSFELTFDVTNVVGDFIIDTCCMAPDNHLLYAECGTSSPVTPAFIPGVITIVNPSPVPTMPGFPTCLSGASCVGVTCAGQPSCPGTNTCPPQITCDGVTCGAASCAPGVTCRGVNTCDGSLTCFPNPTCAGMSTCPQTPTAPGLPTCPDWITCPGDPVCDTIPTMQGQPSCPGWISCADWISCDGSPSCSGDPSCYPNVSCSGWTTCEETATCPATECDVIPTYPPQATCVVTLCGPSCGVDCIPTFDGEPTCVEAPTCSETITCLLWFTCDGQPECEGKLSEDANSPSVSTTGGASITTATVQAAQNGDYPVVFSVNGSPNPAEGLLQPDPLAPAGHKPPNDVYALGPFWGYFTQGELFQSSGANLGSPPDTSNVDRLAAALGVLQSGIGWPMHGPFSPNLGADDPVPPPPGGTLTALGLTAADNINALSFGRDGGDVLLFSVHPTAVGRPGTDVEYNAILSPAAAPVGTAPPSSGGGDPGDEAAGDIYVSSWLTVFGNPLGQIALGPALINENRLEFDEVELGLQAPRVNYAIPIGLNEDDLDALEAADAALVDPDVNGIPNVGTPVYFSLAPFSPSISGGASVSFNDILMSPPQSGPMLEFALYADGVENIGLLPGDDIDALCLADPDLDSLDPGVDEALFSLAVGSPSLAAGANPNMPGFGPFSPGDVFFTQFPGSSGPILMYATAEQLGLEERDELNALDIGTCECALDTDSSGRGDICQFGYTPWGPQIQVVLTPVITVTFVQVQQPGVTLQLSLTFGPPLPTGYQSLTIIPLAQAAAAARGTRAAAAQSALGVEEGTYNYLGTTAKYADSITICFSYDESSLSGPEADLRIFQFDPTAPPGLEWKDVTYSIDTTANVICARVADLTSPLVVSEPISCECDCQGDESCDGVPNVFDVVFTVGEAFRNESYTPDPNPLCPLVGMNDLNLDGDVNVFDVVFLVNMAFRNGSRADNVCDPCTEVGPPSCPF